MELPFAGLHQLCAPMLARLGRLPEPQQRALSVALGLSSGDAPDRFLVALAALSLLAEVAEERPLLCFVDDAQWLDGASSQVLGFVARRLLAESVAIVFAAREPSDDRELAGLPELSLGGLEEEDARALLATVDPGQTRRAGPRPDRRGDTWQSARAVGAPARSLGSAAGGRVRVARRAVAVGPDRGKLPAAARGFPEETRLLLLVAAAEPVGDPALLWRAAGQLGVASAALAPAERVGLLEVGAQVRFRHPLVRSAVYRSASDLERQSVHGALADVTDATLEPDRRAWHRAQATEAPMRTSRRSSSSRRGGRRHVGGSPLRPLSSGGRRA